MPENVLEAAELYHRMGFWVTPLDGKTPTLEGWQKQEPAEEELSRLFVQGRNIGIVLGGPSGLTEVDLRHPLAIRVADRLLPDTLKSGREQSPQSHRWYSCDDAPSSRSFSLPKPVADRLGLGSAGAMLVELRSTGRQTAVPPSIHPEDGGRYLWYPGEIREIEGEELETLAQDVAIATLLALHWVPGRRQRLALCAAGYLGRHMRHERAETILEAAAEAAGDEEVGKRTRAVRHTLDKLKEEN